MSPVFLGVAGGSGSGKTTVVKHIIETLSDGDVTVVQHDRYYRHHPELRLEERAALNYDHPDALETTLLVEHVRSLRAGQAVDGPVYDFSRHMRQPFTERIEPRAAVIIEGILVLADASLRGLLDVKIFVDTADDIRFIRRLQRDVSERGRTVESVIDQYLGTVRPMHLDFVEPSKRYADVIVPEGGHNEVAIDMLRSLVRSLITQGDGSSSR